MKVYTIIRYKGKKVKSQLYDEVVFYKKDDAKKRLKDVLKDLEKEFTYRKDGDSYIVTENKTGTEYTMYVEELKLL